MSAFKGQFGYLDAEKIGYGYVIVGMSKTVMFRPNDAPFFLRRHLLPFSKHFNDLVKKKFL